jgi:hypothetical protein
MRVLAITNLYPNPLQPQRAPFNRNQLRVMGRRHAVRVVAPVAWTDEWARRGVAPLERRRVFDDLVVEHPRYLFTPRILRRFYGRFYLESVRSTFRKAIDEFKPDVVYAPWAYPDGWAAVRLARSVNLPVVLKVHVLHLPKFPSRYKPTRDAVCSADGVVAVSQDLANQLLEMGVASGRIRVVYDGVHL